jgi:hypothetical protein
MVHALTEIWRTLAPGGFLLDLRPYLPFGPLELVVEGQAEVLGRLDEAPYDPGDPAADEAVADVLRRGLFVLQRTESFHYAGYWDSVADLREYLEDWSDVARLPGRLASEAKRALRRSRPKGRLRLNTFMVVNRMAKVSTRPARSIP